MKRRNRIVHGPLNSLRDKRRIASVPSRRNKAALRDGFIIL
jgi:hypothetical protein